MPFTNPYYTPIRREFDIEKANELLDEAGYARDNSGKRFSISMDYLAYSYMSDIIHWVQSEWSKNLGIELILRDRNAFVNIGQKNLLVDFDLFFDELLLWHDPLIGMYRLYAEDNINKNKLWTNIGAYHNQEIEILFKKQRLKRTKNGRKPSMQKYSRRFPMIMLRYGLFPICITLLQKRMFTDWKNYRTKRCRQCWMLL